jgi:ferric-dicitrate binding protein FerR (iron transport regulator)
MTMKSDKPEPEERIDPYLWDGSGQPDSEVERLEALLSPFRYDPSARAIPRVENPAARVRRVRLFPAFAYVAGVAAIAVVLVVMFVRGRQTAPASGPGWVV